MIFLVTKVNRGGREPGATVIVGERFVGEYNPKSNKVTFEDVNGQLWTFHVGSSCEIIERF
ncbi:hypothetical protein [Chryseobacterium oncorhynchi]|uniref:hypothetical protein n=1 Tax=Chryseobacterium oncorhynchi TaxID=741074 RepID=UPI000CCE7D7B|nr:hypothetical protein [Chryseobacterium oncorhynchi]